MNKEVNCINSKIIIDFIKDKNKGDCSFLYGNLDPEIDQLADPEAFLCDSNNWISCTVCSKLLERTRLYFRDPMAAYKLSAYSVKNISLGYGQKIIVKAFWGIKRGLKNLQTINDKWNKSKKVELFYIKRNKAIVRLHWDPQMDVTKDNCLMNQGAYAFMPLIWGGDPCDLEEKSCFFEGDPYCEYHLKWSRKNKINEILSRFLTSHSVLEEMIKEMEKDKKIIERKYEEVNKLNIELNIKIKQLLAIQETGKAILSVLDLDELLNVIINILSSVCHLKRAIILLVNEQKGCLEYLYSIGFDGGVPNEVKEYKIPLDRVSNMLARVANTGLSEYVPEVNKSTLRKDNILLIYGKPSSVYAVPLITRSKIIGVIATDSENENGIRKETREILEVFAPQIAIAIENARLYQKLEEQMEELKKSHALLNRAEKLSFLGNIAARLAHEIKNPMTSIGTFLQMLPEKINDEEFRNDFHKIALEETERVNNLVSELLELGKIKESHFAYDDIHDLIEKMVLLISPQSKGKKIVIMKHLESDISHIWMDTEKMKQVILNLLYNAMEFTPPGGTIDIITRNNKRK